MKDEKGICVLRVETFLELIWWPVITPHILI